MARTPSSLDRLFSELVRRAGSCAECGSAHDLECAHGFSRRFHATRWDLRNAFCLCHRCHWHFTHHPALWDAWLRARWGDELYDELRALSRSSIEPDVDRVHLELRRVWKAVA